MYLFYRYNSPYIAYANGDILFDQTLPQTVNFLTKHDKNVDSQGAKHGAFLVVGQPRDTKVTLLYQIFNRPTVVYFRMDQNT